MDTDTESGIMVWTICLIAGLIFIAVAFWSRFNVPTHTAKLEFFKQYAPKFATREREFRRARYWYVALVASCYVSLSVSPQIIAQILVELQNIPTTKSYVDMLIGEKGNPHEIVKMQIFPLVVAGLLFVGKDVAGLTMVEYRVRSFFHSLGKIPESVQATVKQLKSSTYDHRSCLDFSGPARTKEVLGITNISEESVVSDDVLRTWCTICCLIDRLGRVEPGQVAIRDEFLDVYRSEFRDIVAQREELRRIIAEYAAAVAASGSGTTDTNGDLHVLRADVRNRIRILRERLFVFIACGFRSGAATDAAVSNGLRDFGFDIRVQAVPERRVWDLLGAIVCYVIVMSFVAVLLADWFHAWSGTENIPQAEGVLMIPWQDGLQWLWTLTSGLFSLTAIVIAFTIRQARLNRHEWFSFHDPERRRPVLSRYPWTAILSGCAGMIALFFVNIVMTFFYAPPNISGSFDNLFREAVAGTYPWIPMAVLVALACQHVADDDYIETATPKLLSVAAAWSAIVAIVGLLIAYNIESGRYASLDATMNSAPARVEQLRNARSIDTSNAQSESVLKEIILITAEERDLKVALPLIKAAMPYAALLIGLLIFVQMLFVTLVLQMIERSAQRSGTLTDRWLTLRTSEGNEQEIQLQKGGELRAMNDTTGDAARVGRWVQYPQCQVLHWDTSLPLGTHELRDIGLLERVGGVILYTGLSKGTLGDFVAQGSFTEWQRPMRARPANRLSVVGT